MKRYNTTARQTRRGFIRCRRAAATAITAVVMTLMSLAGFALTSDHVYLVYQRDLFKAAIDSATVATTRSMALLDSTLNDEQVLAALNPIARRYILANISEGKRARAEATLQFTLYPDRSAGTVGIDATAEIGSTIFGRWLWGSITQVTRGGSRVERLGGSSEVILAIDVTGSMCNDLEGFQTIECQLPPPGFSLQDSRMKIVKEAATELVDILTQADQDTAFGLVSWSHQVRLDDATQTRLKDTGLVQYPTRRYYPFPYEGAWSATQTQLYPDPYHTHPGGEWHNMPDQPEVWNGCPDLRSMAGPNAPGTSGTLPTPEAPLLMRFYTPTVPVGHLLSVSYQCHESSSKNIYCYNAYTGIADRGKDLAPQRDCSSTYPPILSLTKNIDTVKSSINALTPIGVATYSAVGITWGHRLLLPSWRAIWGDAVFPRSRFAAKKAIILLTDGEDNQWSREAVRAHQAQACTAAKDAGIKIFTIAALASSSMKNTLQTALENCSSKDDDPEGQYVFINNSNSEQLRETFRTIAAQLIWFRRVY